jgi:hypothetical protein
MVDELEDAYEDACEELNDLIHANSDLKADNDRLRLMLYRVQHYVRHFVCCPEMDESERARAADMVNQIDAEVIDIDATVERLVIPPPQTAAPIPPACPESPDAVPR